MSYSRMLRNLFPDVILHPEDLLLLERLQISYLPGRVAPAEFAVLLYEYPVVQRFLAKKYPPAAPFFSRILEENKPPSNRRESGEQCQEALWEIADLIIYNKHPELLDRRSPIQWEVSEITSVTPLGGKTVADIGAGSGRIAFLVAPHTKTVFAVEPLERFRAYMKEKAAKQHLKNLYAMDGTLDSVPLPDDSLDVLITSNAIGWNLPEELREIERIVRAGGQAIHLISSDPQQENPHHEILTTAPWNYEFVRNETKHRMKIKYFKTLK